MQTNVPNFYSYAMMCVRVCKHKTLKKSRQFFSTSFQNWETRLKTLNDNQPHNLSLLIKTFRTNYFFLWSLSESGIVLQCEQKWKNNKLLKKMHFHFWHHISSMCEWDELPASQPFVDVVVVAAVVVVVFFTMALAKRHTCMTNPK